MSEPKYEDEPLHRLIDGDLDPTEEASLRAALAQDQESAETLRRLERLGVLMRAAGEELQTQAGDPDALFARIQSGIAAEEAANVPAKAATATRDSFWSRLLTHRAWMPAAGMVALAAAVLLTIFRPVDPTELETRVAPGVAGEGTVRTAEESEATPEAQDTQDEARASEAGRAASLPRPTPTNSEVVQVDFGDNAGTVFDVALSGGASTPVIWINDED